MLAAAFLADVVLVMDCDGYLNLLLATSSAERSCLCYAICLRDNELVSPKLLIANLSPSETAPGGMGKA